MRSPETAAGLFAEMHDSLALRHLYRQGRYCGISGSMRFIPADAGMTRGRTAKPADPSARQVSAKAFHTLVLRKTKPLNILED